MMRLILFILLFLAVNYAGRSQTTEEIIQKYLYTIGEDFKTLYSFKIESESIHYLPLIEKQKVSGKHYEKRPNLSRSEHLEDGDLISLVSAFDGKIAWKQKGKQSVIKQQDNVQSLFLEGVFPFGGTLVAPLLINAAENQTEITLLGTVVVDEQEYYELAHKRRGQRLYFYINTATYLLEIHSTGRLQEKILELNPEYTLLKDYRQVGKYLIFHRREYWSNGKLMSESNIEQIIFNPELPDSLFEFPEKP